MPYALLLKPMGVDFFCLGKKFLTYNMVSRNIKIKYRRSFLGAFWTLLSPLAMAMVYYFVFRIVLMVTIPHYLAFVISGVLPWAFFSQTTLEGMESLVGNWGLISKIPVPIQVFPWVNALTNLVTLVLAIPVLIGTSVLSGVHLGPSLILLPVYFGVLYLVTYAFSLILAIAFVYFRDLRHLMTIVMQLLFYGTPVLYSEAMVPAKFQWILLANPLAGTFIGLHQILVDGIWPSTRFVAAELVWAAAIVAFSLWVQKRFSHGLVEFI